MQWGYKECHSSFARRYLPSQSITKQQKQQQYRPQSVTPRCQSVVTSANCHDGAASTDFAGSSPPRRARLKPPLSKCLHHGHLLLILLLINFPITEGAGSNLTDKAAVHLPPAKLRVYPAARHAAPVQKPLEFQCMGGQPPYRWEYQIQEQMDTWRFVIRHNDDNCKPNVLVRNISDSDARVRFDSSTGRLIFDWTEFNDTGIYRCFSTASTTMESGCVELHLLVFEPTSYKSHIRLIYGLFAIVIFVASLSTAWQLWHSSAFRRKSMARSIAQGGVGNSSCQGYSNGNGGGSALNPVMRLFTRNRSPCGSKTDTPPKAPDSSDDARWPVLRRRLSSIEDASVVLTVPTPTEVITREDEIRVDLDDKQAVIPT